MKVEDLQSVKIKIASPEDILDWSHGEVRKPETINYRTQRSEKDGLFCEKIFGPQRDYECYCSKYKGIRFKGIVCDRCGVEVTKSQVRRDRMGHIKLAAPVSHIWFLKGVPSRIGLTLDIPQQKLERVIYFVAYIIDNVDEDSKKRLIEELESEYKSKTKKISDSDLKVKEKGNEIDDLKSRFLKTKEEIISIEKLRVLSEVEYQELSFKYGEIFSAGTGSEVLLKIFETIDIKEEVEDLKKVILKASASDKKKLLQRLKFFQGLERANLRPEWMFLQALPVLPPDLRPMVQLEGGRFASSDLNDLYRRVINRNNRLKYLIEIAAPDAIVRNEKRMLQEAVDSLLDNSMRKTQLTTATTGGKRTLKSLADVLSGKQGRFRKNLLGKRVDYSGRSVIASGPDLKLYECGLPKAMALELFRPFIIKRILDKELAYNIRGASHLIDEKTPEIFTALDEVVHDKVVLLNRAPTLHRLGIQAFHPILIEGEAIKVHPLVCKAYNADFDGDQMAVYVPLSDEAQKEAKELMLASGNLLKPSTGSPIVTPTLDIVLGAYWITGTEKGLMGEGKAFSSFDEVIMSYDLRNIDTRAKVKVLNNGELIETTHGRIVFNNALPEEYPFLNEQINSDRLSSLVRDIILKYPNETTQKTLDKIKELGFEAATLSGTTLGMDDFQVPKEKGALMIEKEKEIDVIESQYKKGFLSHDEKNAKVIEVWQRAKEELEELVIKAVPEKGGVSTIVGSGAKGSWAQPVQICGMKGLVTSPTGRIIELPIKHSFKEGFDVLEYFISTHGARKGTVDTSLRTSASGYLTRRLVDVSHEMIITNHDCGDKKGREVFRKDADQIGQPFRYKIVGRVSVGDIKIGQDVLVKKGECIDWDKAKEIEESDIKSVNLFSPLSCKTLRGLCQKCYGWEMGTNKMVNLGTAVGIIASQSIGEPGTQLTMRTFHLGGVASGGDITRGLPRVEELFELRGLKGEGVINLSDGEVKKVDIEKGEIIIIPDKKASKEDEMKYDIPAKSDVYVKKGDKIKAGFALTAGPIDLKKLYKTVGEYGTQRYVVKEVQRIYVGEGINMHDKHVDVITKQMFSRVKISESGDSTWIPGQVISRAEFEEYKQEYGDKKVSAEPVILGISRVSLTSDSFLSAASFQETSRVLIKAALEGTEDKLTGLKENVIIGRLIPAGTGFRK